MRRLATLAFTACALAAQPALADTSASASLGPFFVSLTDLDPFDALAPTIRYHGADGQSDSSLFTETRQTSPQSSDSRSLSSPGWDSASLQSASPSAKAKASIGETTDAMGNGTWLLAQGSSTDFTSTQRLDYVAYDALARALPVSASTNFTVSPHTQVVFRADARVAAWILSVPRSGADPYQNDLVWLDVEMNVTAPGQSSGDRLHFDGYANPQNGLPMEIQYAENKTLVAYFTNGGPTELSGRLDLLAYARGYTYAVPVPEPGTWVLMLAGALAVGAWAGRRRS